LYFENANPCKLSRSGLRQTHEEQIVSLTLSVAQQIDKWMRKQHASKGWFDPNAEVQKYSLKEIEASKNE